MNPLNIINAEPVAVAGAIRAVLWALVLVGVIVLDEAQLAGIAIAVEAVLTLFVRQNVYAKDTTQMIANHAAATGDASIGTPPSGSPPLPPG